MEAKRQWTKAVKVLRKTPARLLHVATQTLHRQFHGATRADGLRRASLQWPRCRKQNFGSNEAVFQEWLQIIQEVQEKAIPNSIYEAIITLLLKPDKNIRRKVRTKIN